MSRITPYLFFNGTCREALEFYRSCLGGDLDVMTYGDAQGDSCPKGHEKLVMHAALKGGPLFLMASDIPANVTLSPGDNVQLALDCDSLDDLERIFKDLSTGGQVKHALRDEFWGDRFGTLVDRFGIGWMLTHTYKK